MIHLPQKKKKTVCEEGCCILPDAQDAVSPSLEAGGFSEYVLNQTLPEPSQLEMSTPSGAFAM
jgi:hypothetical protein